MWDNRLGQKIRVELVVPETRELAKVLQDGLRQHFEEATVEWVICPDLTQQPFNLASPGICGDPILLELGCISYLFPRPYKNMYSVKAILEDIYKNRKTVSIIGASVCPRESNAQLGELVMNASLLQISQGVTEIKNQSYLAYQDEQTKNYALEQVQDLKLKCYPYGSFFISKGTREYVLKVQAKKRLSNVSFLEAMQSTLDVKYSDPDWKQLVALGGTFMVKNARVKHHVLPYSWDARLHSTTDIRNWLRYFDTNTPVVAMGRFISNKMTYTNICHAIAGERYDIPKTRFHAFSQSGGGFFYKDVESNDTVEYLGYFLPASVLYHIDPHVKNEYFKDFVDMN